MEGREEATGTKLGDGGVNTAGFVCTCAGHSSAEGQGQAQVGVAGQSQSQWYVDSGATHHVTPEAGKVVQGSEYDGPGGGASHALKQTSDSQAGELELIDDIAKLRQVLAANEAVSQNGDKHQGDQGVCIQENVGVEDSAVGVEDSAVGVGNTGDDLEDTDDGADCEQLSTCQGLDQSGDRHEDVLVPSDHQEVSVQGGDVVESSAEEVETAKGDQVSSDGAECEQLVLEEGLSQIDIRCAGDVMTDTYREESALEGADVVSSAR
ncbi:hypothetical protein V6N11_043619 [Hibiscus sabdariffa]|uniref:Uncharacterized protein n=1 Tax=Hibiscus sabdariffa TaxID=183260 RepID=A0ABR2RCT7_9ROSI